MSESLICKGPVNCLAYRLAQREKFGGPEFTTLLGLSIEIIGMNSSWWRFSSYLICAGKEARARKGFYIVISGPTHLYLTFTALYFIPVSPKVWEEIKGAYSVPIFLARRKYWLLFQVIVFYICFFLPSPCRSLLSSWIIHFAFFPVHISHCIINIPSLNNF